MLSRRQLLGGLTAAAMGGCDRGTSSEPRSTTRPDRDDRDAPDRASPGPGGWQDLSFAAAGAQPEQLAALRPQSGAPLLVALHGRGEAGRGLAAGAHGWRDDYDLDKAYQRLLAPPLKPADFHGFVQPGRLAQLNGALHQQPFRGLSVVCPYTPIVRPRTVEGAQPFARFLIEQLLPRARKLAGAQPGRAHTGIDGVSMGGRLALLVGLSHGDVFGAVGALQPAISPGEANQLAELAARAQGDHGTQLRLVSSRGDPFLAAVEALGEAMAKRKLRHQVIITPGPHDYIYNRGPGAYEMLMWHERVLRGGSLPG